MKKIVIYHDYVPILGGVETAIYNLLSELNRKGYETMLVYNNVQSYKSLFNYAKVSTVRRLQVSDEIECDVLILGSNHIIPEQVKPKKIIQWVHSDYDKAGQKLVNKGKVDDYVAVSKWSGEILKKNEGLGYTVIYNLLNSEFGTDTTPRLKLVTNSRVSGEKGFERMLVLAKALKSKGVKFKWVVYGDNAFRPDYYAEWVGKFKEIEEVQFVGYKTDITVGLEEAQYLCQLSDFEGCPLSILEALKLNIPCIVTNWGGVDELIKDGKNGYILPMETKSYARYVDKIVNKIPKFVHKPLSTIDDWIKVIEKKK